eukprot:6739-Amphidinium_carterae.1
MKTDGRTEIAFMLCVCVCSFAIKGGMGKYFALLLAVTSPLCSLIADVQAWKHKPPSSEYEAWADNGVFTRPRKLEVSPALTIEPQGVNAGITRQRVDQVGSITINSAVNKRSKIIKQRRLGSAAVKKDYRLTLGFIASGAKTLHHLLC